MTEQTIRSPLCRGLPPARARRTARRHRRAQTCSASSSGSSRGREGGADMARKDRLDLGGLIAPKGVASPTMTAPQRVPEAKPMPSSTVDERMVALTVKVPASLYAKLKRFAVDHDRTHQDVGLAALRSYLDKSNG